jgi:hypothetical protein
MTVVTRKAIANFCVDSRLEGLRGALEHLLDVDEIYRFKLAGPDGVWTLPELEIERAGNIAGIQRLNAKLGGADAFAIVGHTHCAGYAVSDEEHCEAIKKSAKEMKRVLNCSVPVHAILAERGARDDLWKFKELAVY